MADNKKAENLFSKHQHSIYTSTLELRNFGFSSYEIRQLVSKGILKRISIGQYIIIRKLKPEINLEKYYEMIFEALTKKDYEKVCECFQKVFERENVLYVKDNKFYLYLLSLIIELPSSLIKYVTLQKEEMFVSERDIRYIDFQMQNEIRAEIFNGNYLIALKKLYDFEKNNGLTIWEYLIVRLLSLIIEKELLSKEKQKRNRDIKDETIINKIRCYLNHNDNYNALKTLREYLDAINKREYETLLINIIKLCMLRNDNSFEEAFKILRDISNDNFKYDLMEYLNKFYLSIINKEFEKAKLYLEILKDTNWGSNCRFTKNLTMLLEKETNMSIAHNSTNAEELFEITEEERAFIADKYEELLENKGAILLENLSSSQIDRYLYVLKEYQDVSAFVIGQDRDKIVIRYNISDKILPSSFKMLSEMYRNYYQGDYQKCIEIGLILLENNFDHSDIYKLLGLSYLRFFNKKNVITYLTIAMELNKKNNDFEDLIKRLKKKEKIDDSKTKFKFKVALSEFEEKYYGIANFKEIDEYIRNSSLDVESACLELGLDEEMIYLIILIYAKEYYIQGFTKKGDEFFKVVERSNNKTERVKKALADIRKSKRLFNNRNGEYDLELTLSLKPKGKKEC